MKSSARLTLALLLVLTRTSLAQAQAQVSAPIDVEPVHRAPDSAQQLALTARSNSFFLAWNSSSTLRSARVDAARNTVPPYGNVVSDRSGPMALAVSEENVQVVVWRTAQGVFAARLGRDGSLADGSSLPLANEMESGQPSQPAIAVLGNQFLTAWAQRTGTAPGLRVRFLTASPSSFSHTGLSLTSTTSARSPFVCASEDHFLVGWIQNDENNIPQLATRVLSRDGTILDSMPRILASGAVRWPSCASDGAGWLVTWSIGGAGIYGSLIAPDGRLTDVSNRTFTNTPLSDFTSAWTGSNYLLAWSVVTTEVPNGLRTLRVSSTGQAATVHPSTITRAQFIEREAEGPSRLALAFHTREGLFAWIDRRLAPLLSTAYAVRIRADGRMEQQGFLLSSLPHNEQHPSIVTVNNQAVLGWVDGRELPARVRVMRVSPSGNTDETVSTAISPDLSTRLSPLGATVTQPSNLVLSPGDNSVLAVWHGADSNTVGARLGLYTAALDFPVRNPPSMARFISAADPSTPIRPQIERIEALHYLLFQESSSTPRITTLDGMGANSNTTTCCFSVSSAALARAGTYAVIAVRNTGPSLGFYVTNNSLSISAQRSLRTNETSDSLAGIACTPTQCLVLWNRTVSMNTDSYESAVRGARTSIEGALLDTTPLQFGTRTVRTGTALERVAVEWDGQNYQVLHPIGTATQRDLYLTTVPTVGAPTTPVRVTDENGIETSAALTTLPDQMLFAAYQSEDTSNTFTFSRARIRRIAIAPQQRIAQGRACVANAQCLSGFCVDGMCCNTACGNGRRDDCQACSVSAGGIRDGECAPRSASSLCRNAIDFCDRPVFCTGNTIDCPPETFSPMCGLSEDAGSTDASVSRPDARPDTDAPDVLPPWPFDDAGRVSIDPVASGGCHCRTQHSAPARNRLHAVVAFALLVLQRRRRSVSHTPRA